jgi:hypothetical protein
LIPLEVKVRIFRKASQYQYHYVKALEKNFRPRDIVIMDPIERTMLPDPRICRIIWFDLVQNAKRTVIGPTLISWIYSFSPKSSHIHGY